MPLTSQMANMFAARNLGGPATATVTIQVPTAGVTGTLAEIALWRIWVENEDTHISQAWVSKTVSGGGVENHGVPVVFRNNVTSIDFSIHVFNSMAEARWMLHFYN
jgi:hypothetical protein